MPEGAREWYKVIQSAEQLFQGDILTQCPCPRVIEGAARSVAQGAEVDVEYHLYDVVVLTQSCDLEHPKTDKVVVAATYPFESISEAVKWAELVKLRRPHLYPLRQVEARGLERPRSVVDFREIYRIPVDTLKARALLMDRRLRMEPPFRESLSQHFGTYFSRVGLPEP